MYEAQLLRESGQLQEAINHLDQFEAHICDILGMQEFKGCLFSSLRYNAWESLCCAAEIYMELGNLNDARLLYWKLLKRNPENIKYYMSLEKIVKPTNRLEFYANLKKELPYSSTVKRLPLNIATGMVTEG